MEHEILFRETQKFRQWWLWLIIIFCAGDTIWITISQLSSHKGYSFENTVLPLLILLLPLALFGFIFSVKLETEIKRDGVYVRFFPIHRTFRYYPRAEMLQAYVRTYRPLLEYGGWGLRGLGANRALNISGNQGLQLVMKGGLKLLIGTRQPEKMETALSSTPELKNINRPDP